MSNKKVEAVIVDIDLEESDKLFNDYISKEKGGNINTNRTTEKIVIEKSNNIIDTIMQRDSNVRGDIERLYTVYVYIDSQTGAPLYVGVAVDDGKRRHESHLEESRRYVEFDAWLQDNQDKWIYRQLMTISTFVTEDMVATKTLKELTHHIEDFWVKLWKPKFNKYKK